jgi:transposase
MQQSRGVAAENRVRWKLPAAQHLRIQMVLLGESGMAQPAIAAAMGVSLSTVNRAHMAYDHGGIEALKPKPNGGRIHQNMSAAASANARERL